MQEGVCDHFSIYGACAFDHVHTAIPFSSACVFVSLLVELYLQALRPCSPSRPLHTPAARTPPNPFTIVFPQHTTVTRGAIPLDLYCKLMRRLFYDQQTLISIEAQEVSQSASEEMWLHNANLDSHGKDTSEVINHRRAKPNSTLYEDRSWQVE